MRYFYLPDTNNFKEIPEGEDPVDYGVPENALETTEDCMIWPHTPNEDVTAIVPDMALIRQMRWNEVKALRDVLEDGVAPTPFGPVQADDRSKLKVSGLVQMAQIAWSHEQAVAVAEGRDPLLTCFQETFTLADNSTIVLDAQTAIGVGVAVGTYVSQVHTIARDLRELIDHPETDYETLIAINPQDVFNTGLGL